jgi:hypothetical protein
MLHHMATILVCYGGHFELKLKFVSDLRQVGGFSGRIKLT